MDIHEIPDKEFKITVSKKFCEPQKHYYMVSEKTTSTKVNKDKKH